MTGDARLRLYKGNVTVRGLRSPYSLYDKRLARSAAECSEGDSVRGLREAASYAIKGERAKAPWRPSGERAP